VEIPQEFVDKTEKGSLTPFFVDNFTDVHTITTIYPHKTDRENTEKTPKTAFLLTYPQFHNTYYYYIGIFQKINNK